MKEDFQQQILEKRMTDPHEKWWKKKLNLRIWSNSGYDCLQIVIPIVFTLISYNLNGCLIAFDSLQMILNKVGLTMMPNFSFIRGKNTTNAIIFI